MTGENMIGIHAVSTNVLSRRSDSVRLSLSWLRMAFSRFVMAVVFGLVLLIRSQAATLNVEIDVRTRAVESDTMHQRKEVAIFVLDRSESMKWKPVKHERLANGEIATSRNQLLVESFQERIRAISVNAPNTIVYVVPFSGKKGKVGQAHSLKTQTEVDQLINWSVLSEKECSGCTYLYDTLASVIKFIDKLQEDDPLAKFSLFIYTDGDNQTDRFADYPSVLETSWGRNHPTPEQQAKYEKQLAEQEKRFMEDCGYKFDKYANNGKMETYWRWLGGRQLLANSLCNTKDEYKISLSAESTVMKNPMVISDQKIAATMFVPLPEKYLNKLGDVRCPIVLQLAGRNIDSKMISFKPGKKTVTFQFNDNISPDNFTGSLFLKDLPEWDRVILRPPTPLELTFTSPGRLAFTDIDPKREVFVKKGSKIELSAKATMNASIYWSWPGGTRAGGVCPISFTSSGTFDIVLEAKQDGFLSAKDKITVRVVDAEVGVQVATQQPTVGKPVDFVAKAAGHAEGFAWWIDGQSLSEQGAQLKGFEFKGSGKHKVKVQAYYGHGIVADSGDISFDVAAAPFIDILQPYSGSEYEFGEKFECKASVDGDFDKVVWKLSGPAGEEQEAGVDKSDHVSLPVFFKPTKGGEYKLSATAIGTAGSLQSKATITLRVAHENLGIAIISPASGAPAPLGAAENPVDLQAEVKGEHIVKVKWLVRYATGNEVEIRTVPVQNGNAKCSFRPDPSTKDGDSIFIRAEAVMDVDASSDPVVSPTVELVASRYVEIEVEAKVNGEVANGREVRFGDQVALQAVCKGDIDPTQVRWYKSVGGEEKELDSVGLSCSSPKENPDGDSLRTVYYFARAKLPDGSIVTSRKIVVYHRCPDIDCVIKLPTRDNVERVSFGLNEAFDIGLESHKLVDVKWDFGDGEVPDSVDARHRKYGSYGEFTIKASGKCPNCKKEYFAKPAKIKVERQPAMACFEIEPSKSSYVVNGVVHLIDKSTGDVGQRSWFVNGKEIPDSKDVAKVDYRLPKVPEDLSFSLEVKDVDGKPTKVYKNTIRVRFGWWLIIILFILAMFIVAIAKRTLLGNELLDLAIKAHIGHAPVGNLGDLLDETDNANVSDYHLNQVRKIDKMKLVFSRKINKKLIVSVSDVVGTEDADGNRFGGCSFTFSMNDGVPKLEYDERQFEYVTPRVWKSKSPMDQSDNEPNTRIVVLRDKKCKDAEVSYLYVLMRPGTPRVKSLLVFWIVVGMMLYLVFKCSVTYAI